MSSRRLHYFCPLSDITANTYCRLGPTISAGGNRIRVVSPSMNTNSGVQASNLPVSFHCSPVRRHRRILCQTDRMTLVISLIVWECLVCKFHIQLCLIHHRRLLTLPWGGRCLCPFRSMPGHRPTGSGVFGGGYRLQLRLIASLIISFITYSTTHLSHTLSNMWTFILNKKTGRYIKRPACPNSCLTRPATTLSLPRWVPGYVATYIRFKPKINHSLAGEQLSGSGAAL